LEEIGASLVDRLQEAKEQGWMGEVAAIETTMDAAGPITDIVLCGPGPLVRRGGYVGHMVGGLRMAGSRQIAKL
jgi:hypothetical protein